MSDLNPDQFPWMRSEAVSAIFGALPEGSVRFVGGCVRNALMGVEVGDIDLATQLEPKDVTKALDDSKIRYVPTGIEHGTLTAVIDKKAFEITSLRKDVETDGRRAVVAFTDNWAEDAHRRDLTINALYADFDGKVYDPTDQGLDDLNTKKFRFVGDAQARVQEDYLRILRFFRFLAWYGGDAKVDAAALKACEGLSKMVSLESREAIKSDPLLRLMAMSAREPLQMALLCKRLKMSSKETARLRAWSDSSVALDPHADEGDKLKAIYFAAKQVVIDRARVRAAGEEDALMSSRWMSLADLAMGWTPPEFPLSGKDLKAAGVEPGPKMGKVLEALKALWVRSNFTADREKLLMALKLINR